MSSSNGSDAGAARAATWGQSAQEWAKLEERYTPLYEAAYDRLALSAGMRLIDVGCGTGVACERANRRGAEVVGLDVADDSLAIARIRAPAGTFQQGDMEQLPFDAASFDIVTGFNSFQYAANPLGTLKEARRVVRSDGRVVIAVWDRPEVNAAFVARQQAFQMFLPPSQPDAPGPFALSGDGVLTALVRQAGLTPSHQASVLCPQVYADEDEAVRGSTAGGPAARAMRLAGEEPVRRAVARTLQPFRQPDGMYRFDTVFTYVIATA
jgi:SAM-dependent methyltransferase